MNRRDEGHNHHIDSDKALVTRDEPSRAYPTPFRPTPGGPYSDIPFGLEPERRIGLRDYWRMIRARRWLALASFLVVFVSAALYTFSMAPVYRSEAVVQVVQVLKRAGFALGPKMYSHPSSFVHGEMMLLGSDSMFDEFTHSDRFEEWPAAHVKEPDRFNVLKNRLSEFSGDVSPKVSDKEAQSSAPATPDTVVRHFTGNLLVSRVEDGSSQGSNMVNLQLEAYDPETAHSLLQRYVEFYLDRNLAHVRSEIEEARIGLRKQLKRAENRLVDAEAELIKFTTKHGIVSKTEAGVERLLANLNKSLDELKETQEQKRRIDASDGTLPTRSKADGNAAPDPLVAKLKEDIAGLELDYAKMVSLYSPRYPRAVQIRKRLDILKQRLQEAEKKAADRALAAAKRDEDVIRDTIDQTKKQMEKVNVLETRHTLLKKRVETARKSYEDVLTALNEADVKWGAAVNNATLMKKPRINPTPVRPNTLENLIVGAILGLIAAIAIPVGAARLTSESVEDPRQVADELGAATLGVVPEFSSLTGGRHALPEASYEFLAHEAPNSPMADSINCILTSIGLTHPASTLQYVAVSSSLPGEGKTLVSVSLASKMHSGADKRTLLIDADMRRPRIHKVFGQGDADMGLSSILSGDDVLLEDAVRPHHIRGLYYLTAGPLVADPVQLLRSDRMARLMAEVKDKFDYVVFDCPPMLGLPDVPIVCNYAAGIILVARQGHIKKDDLRLAITAASSMAATEFLGVVLNRVGKQGKGYGYGGYGGYGYGGYGRYGSYASKRVRTS